MNRRSPLALLASVSLLAALGLAPLRASAEPDEIRIAMNGRAAVEEFARFQPDVVTMDITMPEMDGLTAVELILRSNPRALILMVSALADRATAVEAIKRGASGFLLKPITSETIQRALDDLLVA